MAISTRFTKLEGGRGETFHIAQEVIPVHGGVAAQDRVPLVDEDELRGEGPPPARHLLTGCENTNGRQTKVKK